MRTEKQRTASRLNGSKSRGPKTGSGKRRASLNALRHGLLSQIVVLDNECADTFQLVLDQHNTKLSPMDDVEACAVEEMVTSLWRLRRLWGIEKHLLDGALETRSNVTPINAPRARTHGERIAAAFSALVRGPELHLLGRYEARMHRMYQRALNNFLLLREIAPDSEPYAAPPDREPSPQLTTPAPGAIAISEAPAQPEAPAATEAPSESEESAETETVGQTPSSAPARRKDGRALAALSLVTERTQPPATGLLSSLSSTLHTESPVFPQDPQLTEPHIEPSPVQLQLALLHALPDPWECHQVPERNPDHFELAAPLPLLRPCLRRRPVPRRLRQRHPRRDEIKPLVRPALQQRLHPAAQPVSQHNHIAHPEHPHPELQRRARAVV